MKFNLREVGTPLLLAAGLLAVAALAVVTLVVTAYQKGTEKAKPTPSVTEVTVVPSPSKTIDLEEQRFLDHIRKRPTFQDDSDADLLGVGRAVCTAFQEGSGYWPVHATIVSSGVSDYDAGWMISGSVLGLCPTYASKLTEE